MSEEIIDNPVRRRYELAVDGVVAHVDYVRQPGVIRITHTIVPEQIAGRGIGSRLARHVLDDAQKNGEKVVPQCSFIAEYIARHKEYQALLSA